MSGESTENKKTESSIISQQTKIFIVDDHQIVRCGLTQFLNSQKNLEVCGEAADANTAIAMLNTCSPDIAIVDINLEGINGIELIKAIDSRYKNIHILVLSMHGESANIELAMKAGARGYVLKSEPVDQIIDAINRILKGETYISDCLKDKLLNKIILHPAEEKENFPALLTSREFEIFKLIGEGHSRSEIAHRLNLNSSTIGTYRDRIKSKLNITSSSELVKFAVEWVLKH
ncbi:MAG: response regulator transcription factor [bacterium]|nr:response regulator transcription factor [bacterium]